MRNYSNFIMEPLFFLKNRQTMQDTKKIRDQLQYFILRHNNCTCSFMSFGVVVYKNAKLIIILLQSMYNEGILNFFIISKTYNLLMQVYVHTFKLYNYVILDICKCLQ